MKKEKSLIDKKLEEFDKWWDENMLLPTHKTSSKGTQRIWTTAHSGREKTKSFLAKSLQEAQAEVVERVERKIRDIETKQRYSLTKKDGEIYFIFDDLLLFLKEVKGRK